MLWILIFGSAQTFLNTSSASFSGNAHSSHSGIDHKVYGHRLVSRDAIEFPSLFENRNRRNEIALDDCRSFFRQSRPENDDRMWQRRPQKESLLPD